MKNGYTAQNNYNTQLKLRISRANPFIIFKENYSKKNCFFEISKFL